MISGLLAAVVTGYLSFAVADQTSLDTMMQRATDPVMCREAITAFNEPLGFDPPGRRTDTREAVESNASWRNLFFAPDRSVRVMMSCSPPDHDPTQGLLLSDRDADGRVIDELFAQSMARKGRLAHDELCQIMSGGHSAFLQRAMQQLSNPDVPFEVHAWNHLAIDHARNLYVRACSGGTYRREENDSVRNRWHQVYREVRHNAADADHAWLADVTALAREAGQAARNLPAFRSRCDAFRRNLDAARRRHWMLWDEVPVETLNTFFYLDQGCRSPEAWQILLNEQIRARE